MSAALPEFEISAAHAMARVQATQAFADSGPQASRIALYVWFFVIVFCM